ncbi:hypothetical protein J2S74_000104 [Evansella vedderi]|uniref:Uncharacterized protein n=1 Tax=Evansella vedderi TaxID=38282 RepID=A0ABT9ZPU3_9BACI|nr:hypothetical protein [Evansella vedderi]MDQ0252732.1 hypothetical protein [Evansella vedderi]
MITNYSEFVPIKKNYKQEKVNLEDLFKKPLIHRQIKGDEIYTPLDPKRLWGF